MDSTYEIGRTKGGRRILVIKKPVDMSKVDEVSADDFDGVYVEYTHNYVADITVLWNNLPMLSKKLWLKPFFLNVMFEDRFSKYRNVVDDFVSSPSDPIVDSKIDEIGERINRMGIHLGMLDVKAHEDYFINFCRFCVSRGENSLSDTTILSYAEGYTKIIRTLFRENEFIDKRVLFHENLLKNGYIREKRLVERLHVCPVCRNSHILFVECCPKCMSSHIREENVIHHFRCANISPESSYEFDGELRCPKCKRFLRHIGVDYDVPASLYTCESCGHTFTNSDMRAKCDNCNRTLSLDQLAPSDIREYEFTETGLRALLSNEMRLNVSQAVLNGFSNYEEFLSTLWTIAYINSHRRENVLVVIHFKLPDDDKARFRERWDVVIQTLLVMFPFCKITVNGGDLYLMQSSEKSVGERDFDEMRENIGSLLQSSLGYGINAKYLSDVFIYRNEEPVVDFIKKIGGKLV